MARQPVLLDDPGETVRLLVEQYNKLYDAVQDAADGNALLAALQDAGANELDRIDLLPTNIPRSAPRFPQT